MDGIFSSWARILGGYSPSLSIEITRECPLRCPGCYAYGDDHLGGDITLRQVTDYKGQDLIDRVLAIVEDEKPLHVSIVGGEPLVRFRELNTILPALASRGIYTQVVTSAVRRIPEAWAQLELVTVVVSIDGLQPEHDARRKPATYERILENIQGHRIVIHCTVTSQMTRRPDYLAEFVRTWSARPEVRSIRVSFFTPQVGETSEEILTPAMRRQVVAELDRIRGDYPKLFVNRGMLDAYLEPPRDPGQCVFARVTRCVSADLETSVTPCQFGGTPDCANCGCVASIGLHAVGRHRPPGGIRVGRIFDASLKVGAAVGTLRGPRRPIPR